MSDTVTNAAVVVAVVQTLKSLAPNLITGAFTPVLAGCVGAVLGFARNGDPYSGLVDGLVAVGAVTVIDKTKK